MGNVFRVYVEKRNENAVEARSMKDDLQSQLGLQQITNVSVINRYDVQGINQDILNKALPTIFSEPMVDDVYLEEYPKKNDYTLAIEFLPGQYDQRADSCEQCIQILTGNNAEVKVRCARLITIDGELSLEDRAKIAAHLINPVDSREASLSKPIHLNEQKILVEAVPIVEGFTNYATIKLEEFLDIHGLAMNLDDLVVTQEYFKSLHRDPTMTEIKVLDTYWSDHCRHTTFSTILTDINIEEGAFATILKQDLDSYKASRHLVYNLETNRPMTLMDLATIAAKELRKKGYLDDEEISEEINACSIEVTIKTKKGDEQWLLMFKNETHNHPTEIEPYGGAATCLGGAIRDPLSGRAYVYQSMRITGSGDPRRPIENTIEGKLPQRKITTEAAHGFSAYGNQIGLSTGYVHEIYDEGYVAKRMEVGAVIAAAKKEQVKRLTPKEGDIVLLIGGRTGRDGIGGATGSSKSHDVTSTTTAGAEVQKGNPIEERKIQRLFRNKEVASRIIRCNDFGAGGVCVAVGELAPGLDINLDAILKKYEGLSGTELAISESQERMAIVVEKEDYDFFVNACHAENLEVVQVAVITKNPVLTMKHNGVTIVALDREFLDAAGAKRFQEVEINLPNFEESPLQEEQWDDFTSMTSSVLSRLSVGSQKGLVERFDSSIGNNTVLFPYGGKRYRTETEGMAALLPVIDNETTTASLMTYGYHPGISKWSPYHGAIYAVVESIAKIVAMGGDYRKIRSSYQEYFEKLLQNPKKWGKPFSALLGAFRVQKELNIPSIGGKDSMSGTFEDLDVPPTLISFSITTSEVEDIITPEFKKANSKVVEFMIAKDEYQIYNFEHLQKQYSIIHNWMKQGKILSAYTIKDGGIIEAVSKMCFGNDIGFDFDANLTLSQLTAKNYGNIIVELDENEDVVLVGDVRFIGYTSNQKALTYKEESIDLESAYLWYSQVLTSVFPTKKIATTSLLIQKDEVTRSSLKVKEQIAIPHVVIPVFPGTNCEYDSKRAFEKAGASVELVIIKNKQAGDIERSINALEAAIYRSNIVMLPGGFSAGDEPEGSGKFIATVLRSPKLKVAIEDLLENRDGLMIGICNGFQALVKLGLLPYGKIMDMKKDDPTLTFNTIGRHVSQMVTTRISSVKSPWLANVNVGDLHVVPVSHGEGRFIAPDNVIKELFENGQVFAQYVGASGIPTMESPSNPNGSMSAIEGIISKDGRVLGKMAHSERQGEHRYKNIYGDMDQLLFEAGVNYFKTK